MRTDRVPGLGIAKGLVFAFTQAFRPKLTIQYPEVVNDISPRHRGRLILLYDEAGTLKCETCFQCAAACPIECIDMGGVDTRTGIHVHWGPAEQYAERREESALRRSGRPVPDATFEPFARIDLAPLDAILARGRATGRARALRIMEETQDVVRPPAGRRAPAHRPPDRRLVQRAVRHRDQLSAPALRAAHGAHWSRCAAARQCTLLGGGRVLAAFREHLGTDVGGVSPDGAVRLEATDCRGESAGTPRVVVDGNVLPRATAADAATIAAALRATVRPGTARLTWRSSPGDAGLALRSCSPGAGAGRAMPRTSTRPRPPAPGRAWRQARGHLTPETSSSSWRRSGLRGRGGAGYPTGAKWRACAAAPIARPLRGRQRLRGGPGRPARPDCSWSATRTRWSRAWRSPRTRCGATQAIIAVNARLRHGRRRGCAPPSRPRRRRATWVAAPWAPVGALRSRSASSSGSFVTGRGDRAAARARGPARPARPAAAVSRRRRACGASRRWSTTSRPSPPCPGSWPTARAPYAAIGAPDAPGTTLVQLSGAVARPGIVEVPLGTSLRDLRRPGGRRLDGHAQGACWWAARPAASCRPTRWTCRSATPSCERRARSWARARSLAADDVTCIVDLADAPDPLPQRRGVRQDHPLPHRHATPGGAGPGLLHRPLAAHRRGAGGRPRRRHPGRRAVRPGGARRSTRCCPGCDTSRRSSRTTIAPGLVPRRRLPAHPGARPWPHPMDSRVRRDPQGSADADDRHAPRTSATTPSMRSRSGCSRPRARSDRRSRPAFDLEIDGRTLTGRAGQTILEVCRDNGIEVPDAVLRAQAAGLRGLPDVRGRGRGRGRAAHQLLARRGAGDGGPDPDAAPAPDPQDQPGADLQRPQRLLPAALPEQVPVSHIDIPGFLKANTEGYFVESARIFKRTIPFPSVLGRVCPAPCEEHCRRDEVEEAIAIRDSHRYAGDQVLKAQARASRRPCRSRSSRRRGKRAAVIGSGPAGMAAAYYLAIAGHEVTVFERDPAAGGMLRYGIPQYRLPKVEVLEAEYQGAWDLGVKLVSNAELGRDFTISDLQNQGFDAVVRGHRLLRHQQAGHPGRGRRRRARRPGVPAHRDARPALPRPRRQAGRGRRRRLHLHGLLPHLDPPGRAAR